MERVMNDVKLRGFPFKVPSPSVPHGKSPTVYSAESEFRPLPGISAPYESQVQPSIWPG